MTVASAERNKYERMWGVPEYRLHSPGQSLVPMAIVELGMQRGDTVVDFGCGTGRPALAFQDAGMRVTGVDHAANCVDAGIAGKFNFIQSTLWSLPPDLAATFGFCTDVMEHIPTDKVHDVLSEIRRVCANGVFFQIATFPDGMGRRIGETLHLTVRRPDWWQDALRKHWNSVTMRGERNCILVAK